MKSNPNWFSSGSDHVVSVDTGKKRGSSGNGSSIMDEYEEDGFEKEENNNERQSVKGGRSSTQPQQFNKPNNGKPR